MLGVTAVAFAAMAPPAGAATAALADIDLSGTFPTRIIRQAGAEHEWPFSIDEGELTCVEFGRQRHVFFAEILTPEEAGTFGNMKLPRSVVVSANPFTFLATVEDSELYAPFDSLETLIRRLAPYERMGWELCALARDKKNDP